MYYSIFKKFLGNNCKAHKKLLYNYYLLTKVEIKFTQNKIRRKMYDKNLNP